MKFLMDETGERAFNTAFVKKIYLDISGNEVYVCADFDIYIDRIILKSFDSIDQDKNLTAAKKYLVELIDKLNSGGNLVDIGENYE